jgi:hypothetical protein
MELMRNCDASSPIFSGTYGDQYDPEWSWLTKQLESSKNAACAYFPRELASVEMRGSSLRMPESRWFSSSRTVFQGKMFELVGQKLDLPPVIDWVFHTLPRFKPVVHGSAARKLIVGEMQSINEVNAYTERGEFHRLREALDGCEGLEFIWEIGEHSLTVRYNNCVYEFKPQMPGNTEETLQEWCLSTGDSAFILPNRIVRAPRIGWLDIEKRQTRHLRPELVYMADEERIESEGFKILPPCKFDLSDRQA